MSGYYAEPSVRDARSWRSTRKRTKDIASLTFVTFFTVLKWSLRGRPRPEPVDGPTRTQKANQNRREPFPALSPKQNDRHKGQARKGKGKGKDRDNTDDGDDGGGGGNDGDVDEARGPAFGDGPGLTLACPMLRYDPVTHAGCLAVVLKGASAVRQHLARCHNIDRRCHECGGYFGSAELLLRHLLIGQCPSGRRGHEYHDLDHSKVAKLAMLGQETAGWDVRRKWNWLWEQSCPEPGKPPHPDIFMDDLPVELHNWHLEVSDRGRTQLPRVLAAHGVAVGRLNLDALAQDVHTVLFSARRHPHEPGDAPMRTSMRAQILLPQVLDEHRIVDPDRALAGDIAAVFLGRGAGRVVPPIQGPYSQSASQSQSQLQPQGGAEMLHHHEPPQLGFNQPWPQAAADADAEPLLHQPAAGTFDALSPNDDFNWLPPDPSEYSFDLVSRSSPRADQAGAIQVESDNIDDDDPTAPDKPDSPPDLTLDGDAQDDISPPRFLGLGPQ